MRYPVYVRSQVRVDIEFRRMLRAVLTPGELDHFRLLENAMLPGPWKGRRDVRDACARLHPCAACDAGLRPCAVHG